MAKKPQSEEQTKGGLYSNVGNYKGRTLNLSKKQISAAGSKAVAASKQKATNISDTSYVAGKGVMKGGKLFSGRVDLGSGNMAVYVNGKRVRAKTAAGPSTTSTTAADKAAAAKRAAAVKAAAEKKAAAGRQAKAGQAMAQKRGMATAGRAEAASRRPAGTPVSQRKPLGRQPGESVGAYNDRIRNAPLADFFANLGRNNGKKNTGIKSKAPGATFRSR